MARLTQRLGLTRAEADEHYRKALLAYQVVNQKRNLEEALLHMDAAISALPDNAEYYAARGLMYAEDGIDDKAEADFRAALKRFPYEMLAHYGLGVLAFRQRSWDAALAHFTEAYRVDPARPETLYYLAIVYHRRGENEYARQVMARAVAALDAAAPNPDSLSAADQRALERRRSDAGKWLKTFQKLAPG
jgi:tetratricopeptide (TPR) repeat protein